MKSRLWYRIRLHQLRSFGATMLLVLAWVFLSSDESSAQAIRRIANAQAQANPVLDVSAVNGLNINFIPSGEMINKVWVGDPTRVVLDFDTPLEAGAANGTGGASVIRVRKLGKPIEMDLGLTGAAKESDRVSLTVVTVTNGTRKLYQFQLNLGAKKVDTTTVEIMPDRSAIAVRPVAPASSSGGQATQSGGVPVVQRPVTVPPSSAPAPGRLDKIRAGMKIAEANRLLSDADKAKLNQFLSQATDATVDATASTLGITPVLLESLERLGTP